MNEIESDQMRCRNCKSENLKTDISENMDWDSGRGQEITCLDCGESYLA